MDKIALIFFTVGILIFLIIALSLTSGVMKKSRSLLVSLSNQNLCNIMVTFFQNGSSKSGASTFGFPLKSKMFYNNDVIIITPKSIFSLSSMSYINLPLILTNNVEKYKELTKSNYIFRPTSIQSNGLKKLIIKYNGSGFVKSYTVQVNCKTREDKEKILSVNL
ncbi:hypothetical protein [uncultured Draconibacterium sp.]|uniref:hypothetical protein n=1 Tax=uncultured Draconibacterium sp. TaxID=1573823 RepID=UPI0029C78F25|nr:hypothetical protein [uncultured Draconibacterium sp.]